MAQAVGQLRTETGKATEGIQADLKDSARDAQQFSKAVEGGTKVVTALGKAVAQSNTGGFVKNLDAAAAATGRLETSVKGVATQTAKASDELEGIAASARTASTSGKASLTGLRAKPSPKRSPRPWRNWQRPACRRKTLPPTSNR